MSEEGIVLAEIRHEENEDSTNDSEKHDQVVVVTGIDSVTGNCKLVHFENRLANELEEEEEDTR